MGIVDGLLVLEILVLVLDHGIRLALKVMNDLPIENIAVIFY